MAKLPVKATVENLLDLADVQKGNLKPEAVRRVEVLNALVDTDATFLCLPRRHIQQLGLLRFRSRLARIRRRESRELDFYGMVRLTVQGRECTMEVAEVTDDCPTLIGLIPLALLDWVVDPIGKRLIGNPDHGGEQMFDMF